MRKLRNAFVTGLLVLVPLFATIDILRWLFAAIDRSVRSYIPINFLPFDFWGMGLILSLIVILVTGIIAKNYFGNLFITRIDKLIRKFPLVGGVYYSIKKFLETIFSPSSQQFKKTVMVEFPMEGIYSIGFLTGDPIEEIKEKSDKKLLNIFIPMVPNPISGFYIVIPEEKVIPLSISVQDAFRTVISMGIVKGDKESLKETFKT